MYEDLIGYLDNPTMSILDTEELVDLVNRLTTVMNIEVQHFSF